MAVRAALLLVLTAGQALLSGAAHGQQFDTAKQLRDFLTTDEGREILPVDQAFMVSMQRVATDTVRLGFDVHPGHYLYRKKIQAFGPDGKPITLSMPVGVEHKDAYFGISMVIRQSFSTDFSLPAVRQPSQVWVRYQGCADTGICYPPQTRTLELAPESLSPISGLPWQWLAPAGPLAALLGAGAWLGVRRMRSRS